LPPLPLRAVPSFCQVFRSLSFHDLFLFYPARALPVPGSGNIIVRSSSNSPSFPTPGFLGVVASRFTFSPDSYPLWLTFSHSILQIPCAKQDREVFCRLPHHIFLHFPGAIHPIVVFPLDFPVIPIAMAFGYRVPPLFCHGFSSPWSPFLPLASSSGPRGAIFLGSVSRRSVSSSHILQVGGAASLPHVFFWFISFSLSFLFFCF